MNDGNEKTENLSHETVTQALETLFVARDRDEAFRKVPAWQVHRHLAGCEVCQRQYDAVALADRLLTSADRPEPDQLAAAEAGGFERSFGEASFLGALDQMLDEERAGVDQADDENVVDLASERSDRQSRPDMLRRFGLAAAVLLIGGASWFAYTQSQNALVPGDISSGPEQFQPRSAATTDRHGPFDTPEIEIFCTERTPDGVHFTGTRDAPFGLLGCPRDAEIKLAYKNRSPKLHYAAFFGVGQQGKIYWYGPTPADTAAVEVDQSSQMQPFGETIRLGVNHEPGRVRVFGLFSPDPVDFMSLRQTVEDLDRRRLFEGQRPDQMAVHGVLTSNTFEVSDADASDADASDGGKR